MERTEAPVLMLAVAVFLVARFVGVPEGVLRCVVPLGLIIGSAGVVTRNRVLVVVALMLVVVGRANAQVVEMTEPLPVGTINGEALIVSDPTQRDFDVRAVVSVDGRRYIASATSTVAISLRSMQVGETVLVRGTAAPLVGAPQGWVLSNHLAGRLRVESISLLRGARPWYRLANAVRGVIARSGSSFSPEDRALYLGLVVGDDQSQSELQKYRFRASGLSHLLAVSGQNVAFVLAIIAPMARRLGPRSSAVLAVPVLVIFVLVTRAEPSVLRAVTMASTGLMAVATGRRIQAIRMLSLTVVVLVVVDPVIVHSIAFVLSVSATLGLVLLGAPIASWLPGPRRLAEPLAVTIAAQLATAPVLYTMTGTLPSVATAANLLAVPVSGLVMMAGLTVGPLAGTVRADLGAVLMWPVGLMVRWIDRVAETASRVPLAHLGPARMAVLVVVSASVVLVLRDSRRGDRQRNRARVLATKGVGVVALTGLLLPVAPSAPTIDLDGGAVLQRDACGTRTVIVSRGVAGIAVLESLDALGVTSIDVVVSDGSRSAQRAVAYLQEQFQDVEVRESPKEMSGTTGRPSTVESESEPCR